MKNAWTQKGDMPTARSFAGSAVVDGKIYVIGGAGAEDKVLSSVEAYDPAADTWAKKADMPTMRSLPVIAVVDGNIYVIGGYDGNNKSSSTEVYDPATDMWTKKADMPTARTVHAACVIDGRIHVSGGSTKRGTAPGELETWGHVPTVEVYDPGTDTWAQAPDMPRSMVGHSASVVGGRMYIIGGLDVAVIKLFMEGKIDEDKVLELSSIVDVYDPETDTWTTTASCPFVTTGHAAGIVDEKIYIIGGEWGPPSPETPRFSAVYEYDPELPSVSPGGKLLET